MVITLVAIGVGIGLRWAQLGKASLWFDEGYTAWVVSLPASRIVQVIRVDTAPPLYYLLLRGWVAIFGHSEAALRSLSAVFATASLLIFYPLALRLLRDRRAVAVAVALFAVCEMQVAYAHEARFYALMALLAEVDLLLVLSALDGPSVWKYAGLVMAWTASLYVNNIMAVYLAALGLAWLILPGRRSGRGRILDVAIVAGAAGLAFSPWVPAMLVQSRGIQGNFWAAAPSGHDLMKALSILAGVNLYRTRWFSGSGMTIAVWLLVAFIIIGVVRRQTARRTWGLIVFGLLPVLLIFVYSRIGQSIFMERAFIATTVVMPLLIAMPLTGLPATGRMNSWLCAAVAGLWLAPGVVSLQAKCLGEHPEPWREICQVVQREAGPQEAAPRQLIVFVGNEGELLYDYYARRGDYAPDLDRQGVPAGFFALDPPRTMRRVRSDADLAGLKARLAAGDFGQVILIESHADWSDPNHWVLQWLRQERPLLDQRDFTGIGVYRFGVGP
jgi:uncharacterized membrane protein